MISVLTVGYSTSGADGRRRIGEDDLPVQDQLACLPSGEVSCGDTPPATEEGRPSAARDLVVSRCVRNVRCRSTSRS